MTERAPVTVIVPCYNASNTLLRAVGSIFSQSLQPSEIIIVDDASQDDTGAIIDELVRNHPEMVKTISLAKNMGPSYARNIGWEAAEGDYIAFLDSDDEWHSHKLEIQMEWLLDHPNVLMCGHQCIQYPGRKVTLSANPPFKVSKFSLHSMLVSNRFSTPSIVLHRSVKSRFPVSKRHAEDYQLWLSITAEAGYAYRIELPLAWYFKSPYGASGLSAELWPMELGELEAIKEMHRLGYISLIGWAGYSSLSLIKYFRRIAKRLTSGLLATHIEKATKE